MPAGLFVAGSMRTTLPAPATQAAPRYQATPKGIWTGTGIDATTFAVATPTRVTRSQFALTTQSESPPAATHQVSTIPCFGGALGVTGTFASTAPVSGSSLIRVEGFAVSSQTASPA